jgi:hypothetical protein
MSDVHSRFRSMERNRETDERRIALIQEAVSAAVADARAEAAGLRDRIARERRSLISIVEESDSGVPGPSHRSDVVTLEQQILAAEHKAPGASGSSRVPSEFRICRESAAALIWASAIRSLAEFGPISPDPVIQHGSPSGGIRNYDAAGVLAMAFRLAAMAVRTG